MQFPTWAVVAAAVVAARENCPRRYRTPCSACFIRSRSGIANSTMTIPHPLKVPKFVKV